MPDSLSAADTLSYKELCRQAGLPPKTRPPETRPPETRRTEIIPVPSDARGAVRPAGVLLHVYPIGDAVGRRYPLGTGGGLIGRDAHCLVVVDHPSVSRIHASIEPGPDGAFVLKDLGSSNGSYVNTVRTKTARLRHGDFIQLGDCVYRFLAADPGE